MQFCVKLDTLVNNQNIIQHNKTNEVEHMQYLYIKQYHAQKMQTHLHKVNTLHFYSVKFIMHHDFLLDDNFFYKTH